MNTGAPSTTYGMTRKQKQLLEIIVSHHLKNGVSPSYEEMMNEMGLSSKSNIHRLVHSLYERGKVRFIPNRARTIEPVFDQVLEILLPVEIEAVLRERALAHGDSLQGEIVRILRETFYPNTLAKN